MTHEHIFLVALQSSLMLGLIHGINPCGHSWLALAPFVSGERDGRRVLKLTLAFVGGTALACLVIGLTLGAVSTLFPPAFAGWMDRLAAGIIVALGLVLLIRPHLLHSHDHEEAHHHDHPHTHHHEHAHQHDHGPHHADRLHKAAAPGLFAFGFLNMIVPCPTVAIMYSYAINSGSVWKSTAVFGAYAATTALAVGAVIWGLFRAVSWAGRLNNPHIEEWILRGIGLMTMAFGLYSLYVEL